MSLRDADVFVQAASVQLPAIAHPALLAGLAAAAVPALLHRTGRLRAKHVPFSSLALLQAVQRRMAARRRPRHWLLLALRTAALLVLPWLVARPMPHGRQAASSDVSGSRRVALIVDISASMAYVINGKTLLQRAIADAQATLAGLQPGDMATVLAATADAGAPQLVAPTEDRGVAHAALADLARLPPRGIADVAAALQRAARQFGSPRVDVVQPAPNAVDRIDAHVFGDLARNGFVDLHKTAVSPASAAGLRLILRDAAHRRHLTPLGNVAIEQVEFVGDPPPGGNGGDVKGDGVEDGGRGGTAGDWRFNVAVRNFGAEHIAKRGLTLRVDGEVVARTLVAAGARQGSRHSLTHRFARPGRYRIEVALAADLDRDGYAADDTWRHEAVIAPRLRVLAVNGEPRPNAYDDELYFLERALTTMPRGEAAISVQSCAVAGLLAALRADQRPDVVVLANVDSLAAAETQALRAFVAAGGGLWATLGRHVDFERANAQLGSLLPHPLRALTDAPAATGIGRIDWTHPVLDGLGEDAADSLRHSRTRQYFHLDTGVGSHARVILSFAGGAPALVEAAAPAGGGRVLLWTTSVDLDLTDLPLRTAFVPLVQRLVRYLGGRLAPAAPPSLRVPATFTVALPTGGSAMAWQGPDGANAPTTVAAGGLWRIGPLMQVGTYAARVRLGTTWEPTPQLNISVNARLDESDFTPVDAAALQRTQSGGVAVASATPAESDMNSSNHDGAWLLWLLVVAVVAEGTMAAWG